MFDISELEKENKRKWLDRMEKKDPDHAALFCPNCVAYIGAAKVSCKECAK